MVELRRAEEGVSVRVSVRVRPGDAVCEERAMQLKECGKLDDAW